MTQAVPTPAAQETPLVKTLADKAGVQPGHIEQYFGPWCVMPERFMPLVERMQGTNVLEHIEARRRSEQHVGASSDTEYEMIGATALLHATGTLTKYGTSYGDETSTVALRRQIRLAANDDVVKTILLRIESPGGTCAGTQELAADIAAAAAKKPVIAYCEDLCCSAGYWLASQCSKIYANATAIIGSIGTYAVVQDSSGMAEKLGIKVHLVTTGDFKGAATPGTEVSDKQLAEWQRLVDSLNQFFLDAVANGRKMSAQQVKNLADGRVHVGQEAQKLGLVDAIKTFDETLDEISQEKSSDDASSRSAADSDSPPLSQGSSTMSNAQTTAPAAASLAELKTALPGASSDFILACLEGGKTIPSALADYAKSQADEIKQLKSQLAAKKAKAKESDESETDDEEDDEDEETEEPKDKGGKAKKAKATGDGDDEPAKKGKAKSRRAPGVDPLANRNARRPAADSQTAFNELVMSFVKAGHDRRKAVALAARANPDLHQDVLLSDPRNSGAKVQDLISERFAAGYLSN